MRFFIGILLFLVADLVPVAGQRIYDQANIIDAEIETELNDVLLRVERSTSAQVAVVTVPSLEGRTVEQYAAGLFSRWGIGDKSRNNGLLFLISNGDRRARIEVGYGLEQLITDALAGELLDVNAIPQFKAGDFGGGIRATTMAIAKILEDHPEAARGVPGSAPYFVYTPKRMVIWAAAAVGGLSLSLMGLGWWAKRKKHYSKTIFFMVTGVFGICGATLYLLSREIPLDALPHLPLGGSIGALLLGAGYNVRRYRRYRPHYCKKCSTELRLLSEKEDDAKLRKEERLEESLGSVDYDIWVCPACFAEHKEEYIAFMSSFSSCKKCNRRTFSESTTTIKAATEYSSGLARVDGECRSCFYRTTRNKTIPRIRNSDSSSSSSSRGFGGGSSGGGGASRGW